MIIDHTNKDLSRLECLITKNDGTPLQGEIDMYRRIIRDCEKSNIVWHFWHDVNLHIPSGKSSEIQIDFLLVSKIGALVIEVKGGAIQIEAGKYFYQNKGILTQMNRSPFKQAEDYQWSIINNKVINGEEVFVDYICAFPHSSLEYTNNSDVQGLSYKMWNKYNQDSEDSFADFCVNVVDKDKRKRHWYNGDLSENVLELIVSNFAPTIRDPGRYNQSSLKDILNWLNISNSDTLESLKRNHRIMIEGGPGTGKTTIAKAYIKKNKGLHGLYLCWTKLLAAQVKFILQSEGLYNCDVESYATYIYKITNGEITINELNITQISQKYESIITKCTKEHFYDYVIIDEAQDVADKGMFSILNNLTSLQHTGVNTGRFLLLYDIEQGYNSGIRGLDSSINEIIHTSAHYIINGNKRVPTNIEIVKYADEVLNTKIDKLLSFWNTIKNEENACKVHIVDDSKTLTRLIKQKRKEITLCCPSLKNTTLLIHSDLTNPLQRESDSIYDKLSYSDSVVELDSDNICNLPERSIGLSSILKYKGLENDNIILVIPLIPIKSSYENFLFEIYVGMTRAIMNIDIYIINNKLL